MPMIHSDNILINDRASIQLRSDVVTGCADQLNTMLKSLVIRLNAYKRGQEAMMNIDNLAKELLTEFSDKNLHKPCENECVTSMIKEDGPDHVARFTSLLSIHAQSVI